MARYKHTAAEYGQGLFLTVNLKEQLLPGTFEYMLDDLTGKKIDTSMFDGNYKNDLTGAGAIPPRALIKLIIYGYSKGVGSPRGIAELSRNNMTAKALAEDMEPHWTTAADFIPGNSGMFKETFVKVLLYCAELGLTGGQAFAVDGRRIPPDASLELTGTAEELEKKGENNEETETRCRGRQKELSRHIEKTSAFLEGMEKKEGKRGKETRPNVTDNESALIYNCEGYIQGYTGPAVADKQEQITASAEAVGTAYGGPHFPQMLDSAAANPDKAGVKKKKETKRTILAGKGCFSEENLQASRERGVEAVIAGRQYKNRLGKDGDKRYEAGDFKYHNQGGCYICPNGKKPVREGPGAIGGHEGKKCRASVADCRNCPLNLKCLKSKKDPGKLTQGRGLFISEGNRAGSLIRKLRKKLNTQEYQDRYAYRIQIIEPVFSNIAYCKKLNRFSLRGRAKVSGQWRLFCMAHNLGKCLKGYNKEKGYA